MLEHTRLTGSMRSEKLEGSGYKKIFMTVAVTLLGGLVTRESNACCFVGNCCLLWLYLCKMEISFKGKRALVTGAGKGKYVDQLDTVAAFQISLCD